jgi:N-acyl-D-aspartate/D-glutamate deacylase
MHDLVIRGGTLVDGTGSPGRVADLAIEGRTIVAVGGEIGAGRREIDATGQLVTPGWVDVHTHYDGQVTWDPYLSPSSWHGVTTVVMGNCGVGFAPVRPGQEQFLMELMEGVEDIPESVLSEGMPWNWETFGEYLDVVDGMDRAIDVAAQVPHCAVRAYVMGERAHETEVSEGEIAEMRAITREALEAGAVGFSTSRTILHSSKHGLVPGTWSTSAEMLGIGGALGEAGHGVFEMLNDQMGDDPDLGWMREFCEKTGRKLTFTFAQRGEDSTPYQTTLAEMAALQDQGVEIWPQVACRAPGLLFGLQGSINPFRFHPTFLKMEALGIEEKVAELRKPEIRAKLLAEQSMIELAGGAQAEVVKNILGAYDMMYLLGNPPDYEPHPDRSAAAIAAREGRDPKEVLLDWLLEADGQDFIYRPLGNYADGNLDAVRNMVTNPQTVIGLSDGGAHCSMICDASMPSYLLTYWARDRKRGEGIAVEEVVRKQTSATAKLYGFDDRGVLAPGMKADVNVIDWDRLHIHAPEKRDDLPAGGSRLVQRVDGYTATICSGEVIFENGEATGSLPGKLLRGPQPRAEA